MARELNETKVEKELSGKSTGYPIPEVDRPIGAQSSAYGSSNEIEIDDEIILCKCFSCKRNYIESVMKPVKIKEPEEESYIIVKRYLCPVCFERLKQIQFIQESDAELKSKKEVK